nr:MAG TPA: hypothetical protein [Caudoviricetes sp.]
MRIVRRRYEADVGSFSTIIPSEQTISGVQTVTPSITRPNFFESRHRGSLMVNPLFPTSSKTLNIIFVKDVNSFAADSSYWLQFATRNQQVDICTRLIQNPGCFRSAHKLNTRHD